MDVKLVKFLNKQSKNLEKILKNYQSVKIVFDEDVDGLMSCLIVLSVLEKLNKKIEIFPIKVNELKNFLSKQKDIKSLYIFLDLSLERDFMIEIRNKNLKCIWIDHHQLKVFSSKHIFFVNPLLVNPLLSVPTSAVSYILFERIYYIDNLLFFASIGIVADRGEIFCKNILEKVKRKFNIKLDEIYEISKKINSIFVLKKDIKKYVKKIKEIKFFRSRELQKIFNRAKKIIEKEIKNAMRKHEKIDDVILYRIESKYNLRGLVANILSEKFKDKIIIVYDVNRNEIILSLRTNLNINLLEMLKSLEVEYKTFGGHKNACGATISKKEFKKFLEGLKEYGRIK